MLVLQLVVVVVVVVMMVVQRRQLPLLALPLLALLILSQVFEVALLGRHAELMEGGCRPDHNHPR